MKYSYLERHSFFHLLFVYAIFLLLMLLLMLPILNRASRALEESVVASYTTEIARNTARFDEQMDSFMSIIAKIVNDSEYSYALRNAEESSKQLLNIKELQ